MFWWKEIMLLRRELKEVRSELESEQGKAARLAGFIGPLMSFGVSPAGGTPRRAFGEALMDSTHALLKIEQAVLFESDPDTLDLLPIASRGVSPQILSRLRVHTGEGVLGQAAAIKKMIVQNTAVRRATSDVEPATQLAGAGSVAPRTSDDEDFLVAPYLIVPLLSLGQCVGLLVAAKPQSGSFSAEDRGIASLLAAQAALVLEDHSLYEIVERSRRQTVAALARALEAKDSITHHHSDRTRALVRALTQELSLPEILVQQIEDGAFLHDIGKIGIEDAILKKTNELTPEEYAVMKTHAATGKIILEAIPTLSAVASIVLYHQEWYNGTGYPEGLAGEEIPLGARIVQILDAWDAMTSDRTYRKAISKAAAIAELRRQAGTQFDPKLVDLFLRVLDRLEREGIPTTELRSEKSLASQRA